MAGILVSIDGIDCAGKNTQARLLTVKLRKLGHKVSLHSYPEYTSIYGKILAQHLDKTITLNTNELFLIFLADMIKDKAMVNEELKRGDIVIMDRYFIETVAYQTASGFDYEKAKKIEDLMGLTKPSLIIYLDISPALGLERKLQDHEKPDRNEENLVYLEKVRTEFEKLFKEGYTGAKWMKIDGTKSIEEVHETIMPEVTALIPK